TKFDHLRSLGVTAVELMPIMEFAGDLSWGYNPAHLFAVESSYGGPDALKTFVREAHKAGLGVILDVVYNHFGPSDLATWQFDGWSENGKGGIYFYNDDRSSTPWGDTRPDYGRGEVRQYLHDNVYHWLENFHVDGLRYDMTPFIRSTDGWTTNIPEGYSLLRWLNTDVRRDFPGKLLIAEDLHGDDSITSTDGAAFHAQWDADFVHPIRTAIEQIWDNDRSMSSVANALTHEVSGNAFARVIYTESHDEDANGQQRMNSEVDPHSPGSWLAQKRSTLGAALVFTAPGIPMLFQGQEFMQGGYFTDSATLDWHLSEQHHGIVMLYRDLIALRLNKHGLSKGLTGPHIEILHRDDEAKVLVFHRWRDGGVGDDVVVVASFSDRQLAEYSVAWAGAGRWQLLLNSDAAVYSDDFSNSPASDLILESNEAELTLAPYSVLIFGRS
ncbi:MAG: alpha-amylase family glycosyl hydrolase, partial [Propionibacteriaceae bacterium]